MKAELLRDRTLDWMDRFFNGPWVDRMCLVVIVSAVVYFGPWLIAVMFR